MADGEHILLTGEERSLLEAEIHASMAVLPEGRQTLYQELLGSVRDGTISAQHLQPLEKMLEWSLRTGRARREHLAEGEKLLEALYWRMPSGRACLAHAEEVNRALKCLRGRSVAGVRVLMRSLNTVCISIEAEGFVVTLVIRPPEVDVESVATG